MHSVKVDYPNSRTVLSPCSRHMLDLSSKTVISSFGKLQDFV
jgi:hypothetical protein